jgi:hypothetical protein
MGFTIGKISFAAAFLAIFGVYANFWVRSFIAWYTKNEPPKDRVRFGALAFGVFFFIIGCIIQAEFDQVSMCTDAGNPVGQCIWMQKN